MAFPNQAAARAQYLKTQVETASKEQLVVMLFDGIVRFTEVARKAIENKEIENSHNALMRAQAIVMELIVTIDKDKGGDVAKNLMALHAYALNCLVQCNLRKDVSKIDEVQNIYRKLREGWVGAMDSLGIAPRAAQGPAAQAGAAQAGAARPGAPVAGGRPVPPTGGKPLPTGAPQAPATQVGARPLAQPQQPGAGGGVLAARPGASIAAGARPAAPAAAAAARPVAPVAGKPVAPVAPGAPGAPVAKPAAPVAPAAKPAAPAAAAPVAGAAPQAAPRPAMPAGGYGIGRTANMMNAYGAKPAMVPPAAAQAAPIAAAQAAAAAKQNPAVGAYQQLGARSIA